MKIYFYKVIIILKNILILFYTNIIFIINNFKSLILYISLKNYIYYLVNLK